MPKLKKTGLGPRGDDFYARTVKEFNITDAFGEEVVRLAAQCLDRVLQCRGILELEGVTYRDRTDTPRQHPATKVEHMAKVSFCSLMRLIGLDPTLELK